MPPPSPPLDEPTKEREETTTTTRTPSRFYRYQVSTGKLSERTKQAYTHNINEFLAHYRITDLTPLKEYSPKVLKQMVKDYIIHLRDNRKLSGSSISLYVAAIAHFFYIIRDDDYKIDWKKVRLEIPPSENIRRDRAYTIEEIQKMLSVCSRTREKVIVLLLVSTGLRIGAIHTLKFRDISPKQTSQGRIYRIEIYSSSSERYIGYCNPETAKIIDDYLKERTDAGEILKNDTPLIRNLYTSLTIKISKKVSDPHIKYIVGRIVKLSGIKNTFQFTGEAKRAKGFRKFYKTEAEIAGMKPINVELTHGHSIGISSHYYRPLESEVLEDYMTHAADALTINETHRQKKRIEELETEKSGELKQLKAQLIEYKEFAEKTAAEINDLKATRGLESYESSKFLVDPNFSNIVNAINELRTKNGQEPVAIVTPQEAAEKAERTRIKARYIRETKECPPLGLTDDYK